MDSSQAVQTASEGRNCRECGKPLPERPASAKEHLFCPGGKCRSAWHRKEHQRALNAALWYVEHAIQQLSIPGDGRLPALKLLLQSAHTALFDAGAEPKA